VYTESHAVLTRRGPELLETDLTTNPGNSGAPLIRAADQTVVGMVVTTAELGGPADQGRHRALPINTIERICRERQVPIR
jgi:S1-C subfamily serine protease